MKPIVLIILDGWGIAPPCPGNAVALAKTPNFDRLWAGYPHTQLEASGEAVGLPPGQDGNSETGHLNIGAGRVVYQDLLRINKAIAEGTFFKNKAFLQVAEHVREHDSGLHLMGLITDSAVHASLNHLFALLRVARDQNLKKVFLHLFTDGRDSPPTSAMTHIKQIEREIDKIGVGQITTLVGRYYAMDRDLRWERTEKAYDLLTLGKGKKFSSVEEAIDQSYREGTTDEFIEPAVLVKDSGQPTGLVGDNDGVIFYNFRTDRPRQLTKAFVLQNFETAKIKRPTFDPYAEKYSLRQHHVSKTVATFKREKLLKNLLFVAMTEYEKGLPVQVAFPSKLVKLPLAEVVAEGGLRQLHIAETEKFPHVTHFFNGGRETKFSGEDQLLISSPKVATYDQKPEMSAYEVTDLLLKKIETKTYDFIIVNFANPDMVGHTGVLEAGIKACEVTDECLGKVVRAVMGLGGTSIVTADHGNVEEMINSQTGEVDTEHSTNLVPFMVVSEQNVEMSENLPVGVLADIAPTVLGLLGIPKPSVMTGRNLLANHV